MSRLRLAACAALLGLACLPGPARAWWKPNATDGLGFNYQLGTDFDPSSNFIDGVQVYFIDGESATKAMVDAIHAKGYRAVCYFSAGSYETYRPDASSFPASVLGNVLDGWPNEKWLDIRQISVLQPIMKKRMQDWCQAKGFDAVDPDNMDGYTNDSGFPLEAKDQLAYNRMIASVAHGLGLGAGLKNDLDQLNELTPDFDFFVNEQCFQYNECDKYAPSQKANKPVWNVEYKSGAFSRGCRCQSYFGVTSIKKTLKLKPPLTKCSARIKDKRCRYDPSATLMGRRG